MGLQNANMAKGVSCGLSIKAKHSYVRMKMQIKKSTLARNKSKLLEAENSLFLHFESFRTRKPTMTQACTVLPLYRQYA